MNTQNPKVRYPAGWETHAATWLVWPHHLEDWPGKFEPIPSVYLEIIRKILPNEPIYLLVNSNACLQQVNDLLNHIELDRSQLHIHQYPTDRSWIRDCGAITIESTDDYSKSFVRFEFNGWALFDNWQKDNRVPEYMAEITNYPCQPVVYNGQSVILEGGSIDVNGRGTLITSEECLVHPTEQVRNQSMHKNDYEQIFSEYLGIQNTLWLGRGLDGDATHGHIDAFCRFINERTVVLCKEENTNDPNHFILEENRERLEGMCLEDGSKIETIFLPMPDPLYYDGYRLPATYANFYAYNGGVLVPTYNDSNDYIALGIMNELFPDHKVIGINSVDLVLGGGSLHCSTMEQM